MWVDRKSREKKLGGHVKAHQPRIQPTVGKLVKLVS